MSTLLRDAIAAKIRRGMSAEDAYNTHGVEPMMIEAPSRQRAGWAYDKATAMSVYYEVMRKVHEGKEDEE